MLRWPEIHGITGLIDIAIDIGQPAGAQLDVDARPAQAMFQEPHQGRIVIAARPALQIVATTRNSPDGNMDVDRASTLEFCAYTIVEDVFEKNSLELEPPG